MITLETMVAAFLNNNDQYLLMKRSPKRNFAPNMWSGIGGHMEPEEINNPLQACYREIYEETGICREHIHHLVLRYIIIRRSKDIIKQSYIYFGETDVTNTIQTEEGALHWRPKEDLLNLAFTSTFAATLYHYVNTPENYSRLIVGVAANNDNKLNMSWTIAEDFEDTLSNS